MWQRKCVWLQVFWVCLYQIHIFRLIFYCPFTFDKVAHAQSYWLESFCETYFQLDLGRYNTVMFFDLHRGFPSPVVGGRCPVSFRRNQRRFKRVNYLLSVQWPGNDSLFGSVGWCVRSKAFVSCWGLNLDAAELNRSIITELEMLCIFSLHFTVFKLITGLLRVVSSIPFIIPSDLNTFPVFAEE